MLRLFLNEPEEIQDKGRYDGIADKNRQAPRGQELIDGPKTERGREKQASRQRPPARPQPNLQDGVRGARERQWE